MKSKELEYARLEGNLRIINKYEDFCKVAYRKTIDLLPEEHKHTSLDDGLRCDLSYQQGKRDAFLGLKNILFNHGIDTDIEMEELIKTMGEKYDATN